MNNFTKCFWGLLGTTVLNYPSPSQADPLSSPFPANDTFLGKLGTTARTTRDGLIYGNSYVKFSTATQQVNEGDGAAKVTVARSCSDEPLPAAFVSYQITDQPDSEAKQGVDYGETYGTLRWEANECGVKELRVPIIDDHEPEFDESFRVEAMGGDGSGNDNILTVITIVDNDTDPVPKTSVLSFAQQSYQLDEGKATIVTVERQQCGPHSPAVSVDVVVTPEIQTDYEILPSWSHHGEVAVRDNIVTLRWEEAHSKNDCDSKYFYLASKQDNLIEPIETVELTLANPSKGAVLGQSHSVTSILDDDSSTVGFAQRNYEVAEGEPVDIIVERKNCVGNVPTATVAFSGTGMYDHFPTVSWQENECGSKPISSSVNRGFGGKLINASGTTIIDTEEVNISRFVESADGTLVSFSQPHYNVLEGTTATIDVERTGCQVDSPAVAVRYRTHSSGDFYGAYTEASSTTFYSAGYSAEPDFQPQEGSLSWEAGECGVKSFTLPTIQDTTSELNERLSIYFWQAAGVNPYRSSATLTILDDDPAVDGHFFNPGGSITLPLGTDALDLSGGYYIPTRSDNKAPFTWQVSDEHIAKVDEAGNVTALALGQTTITMTDVYNNSSSWQVTVIPKELTILTFSSDFKENVGNYLDVRVNTKHVIPDHNQQTDLWIGIHLTGTPDDQLLYVTDSSHISSLLSTTPQPFKRGLQRIDNTYPILHFVVTPDMVGEYTLYAMLTESGKTPFEDAAQRSVLAIQTIKLH